MRPYSAFFLFFTSIIMSLTSCSKHGGGDNPPGSTTPTDTLSPGWTKSTIPNEPLSDIVFLNNTIGYTGGDKLYKTTDGGLTWTKLITSYSGVVNLAVTNDGKLFAANDGNTIFRSADGGATSTSVATGSGGTADDIYFLDNNKGYSLTSSGLTQTIDGGQSWQIISPITGLTINAAAYKTCLMLSTSVGWLTIGPDVYRSMGNLNTWVKSSFPIDISDVGLISLFAVSASLIYVGTNNGQIFQSVDGGATFALKTNFGRQNGYLDLRFFDANTGYACYGNRIYRTNDAGSNWLVVAATTTSEILEIDFTDVSHGWGCTSAGEVLKFN